MKIPPKVLRRKRSIQHNEREKLCCCIVHYMYPYTQKVMCREYHRLLQFVGCEQVIVFRCMSAVRKIISHFFSNVKYSVNRLSDCRLFNILLIRSIVICVCKGTLVFCTFYLPRAVVQFFKLFVSIYLFSIAAQNPS